MNGKQSLRMLPALLGGAACFLALALILRWNFAISALLGIGIYLAIWFIAAPKAEPKTVWFDSREDGAELAAMMEEARRDLDAIRTEAAQIEDKSTRNSALALTVTGEKIYKALQDNPEKIPDARRFLTYYLDTVGKILKQYTKEQQAGLHTKDAARFDAEIRSLLPKLNTAFEQQLNNLMEAERFDAQADITVLENMINMEGLTGTEEWNPR